MKENEKKTRRQDTINYIVDNLFDLISIGTAAYVFARHEFIQPFTANDIGDLASWIIAILGLLAVSGLWERHRRLQRLEHISLNTNYIVSQSLAGKVRSADFFWKGDKKVTSAEIGEAEEIYVVGMVLNRTSRDHLATFGERVEAGANLRFIILDYEDDSLMNIMPHRSYGTKPSDWWRNRVRQTAGHFEDIPNTENPKGTIKVGLIPYFPSFGMWLIDPEKSHGKIVVEIYHHQSGEPNPTFTLVAETDPYWYSFFQKQFKLMWDTCEKMGKVRSINTSKLQMPPNRTLP